MSSHVNQGQKLGIPGRTTQPVVCRCKRLACAKSLKFFWHTETVSGCMFASFCPGGFHFVSQLLSLLIFFFLPPALPPIPSMSSLLFLLLFCLARPMRLHSSTLIYSCLVEMVFSPPRMGGFQGSLTLYLMLATDIALRHVNIAYYPVDLLYSKHVNTVLHHLHVLTSALPS